MRLLWKKQPDKDIYHLSAIRGYKGKEKIPVGRIEALETPHGTLWKQIIYCTSKLNIGARLKTHSGTLAQAKIDANEYALKCIKLQEMEKHD